MYKTNQNEVIFIASRSTSSEIIYDDRQKTIKFKMKPELIYLNPNMILSNLLLLLLSCEDIRINLAINNFSGRYTGENLIYKYVRHVYKNVLDIFLKIS